MGNRTSKVETSDAPGPSLPEGDRLFTLSEEGTKRVPADINEKPGMRKGKPNMVSTTKFTIPTWLPKSLYYQFQRMANIYFLFISVIVCFSWSPKDWPSFVLPFIGVLLWTACKDAYEDIGRWREDEKENSRKTQRWNAEEDTFEDVQWRFVHAGDLLKINCDECFPADLLLLQAAGGNEGFISTVNLDGETNLKEKCAPNNCGQLMGNAKSCRRTRMFGSKMQEEEEIIASRIARELHAQGLTVQMGRPEMVLSEVRGNLDLEEAHSPAGEANFLPRGCVLRNTLWVLCLAVYVGNETKTRLNAVESRQKTSRMQHYLDISIRCMLVGLCTACAYLATLASVVGDTDDNWIISFLKYMITLYHVVPISLYVVCEMLKLFLGIKVDMDVQMKDPDTERFAKVQCTDLLEEVGQVGFIFSDKTGTLTANEMVFARACISGQDPGDFRRTAPVQEGREAVQKILRTPQHPLYEAVSLYFTCLAVCHAVQVEEMEDKAFPDSLHYSGMSPDEVALVQAASSVGFHFRQRKRLMGSSSTELSIEGPASGELARFTVLREIEFNSDRKRMSVVVQHNQEYWCVTKGADNVMIPLLDHEPDSGTVDALAKFSKIGLRCLVVGMKKVSLDELTTWQKYLQSADSLTDASKNDRVAEVSAAMETNLRLVGVTAVEDRLQDGVPHAIDTIKRAGVKLWVLTGDKTETAVDIARSCNLFHSNTKLGYATEAISPDECLQKLERAKADLDGCHDAGLVLDGKTTKFALESEACRKLVYKLGLACRTCVCCRLSPMQKKHLVDLVRQENPKVITLAIGDGANDVPMIEGAHIGVGIRGKEGMQAAQSSDIAISQFRFLVPLMFCHGSRAYRRIALFICYYIYKSVALAVGDFIWAHQDNFRGQIAYPEYLSMGYSVVFTAWHVVIVLGFDAGLSDEITNESPEMYKDGPSHALFNRWIFGTWIFFSLLHGSAAWLAPNLVLGGLDWTPKTPNDFWLASMVSFTVVVIVCNARLHLNCLSPLRKEVVAASLAAFFSYWLYLFMLGHTPLGDIFQPSCVGLPAKVFTNSKAFTLLVVCSLVILIPDVIEKLVRRHCFPTATDKVMREARRGKVHNGSTKASDED